MRAWTGGWRATLLAGGLAVGLGLWCGQAAAATTGTYAGWSVSGASGNWTGTVAIPAAGFPVGTLTSTATTLETPSGASAFLGPATPVGAVYGSSQGRPYVNIPTAAGATPSTTTITFPALTPRAGWAFAIGDVDADTVTISATDAVGAPVPAVNLGWQGAFNYCAVTPKPGSCTGPGPFTDQPTWNPLTSTVVGNGVDSAGASGWFQPTVPLRSLTFVFTRLSGIPLLQLWLAALSVPLTGQVAGVDPGTPPPGIRLELLTAAGVPVVTPDNAPVVAVTDDQGRFAFPAVADGDYLVRIDVPPGMVNLGAAVFAISVEVSLGSAAIPAGTFRVRLTPTLPITGPSVTALVAAGLLLFGAGLALRIAVRHRP